MYVELLQCIVSFLCWWYTNIFSSRLVFLRNRPQARLGRVGLWQAISDTGNGELFYYASCCIEGIQWFPMFDIADEPIYEIFRSRGN